MPGSVEGVDPYQLALWALRETAARINGPPVSSSVTSCHVPVKKMVGMRRPGLGFEGIGTSKRL